jgi:uncharacterized membrane protein YadS
MTKKNTLIAYSLAAILSIFSQQAALALFSGIALAVVIGKAPLENASAMSRGALQSGVVILGLSLPFREVITLGSANGVIVSVMVLATLISGYALMKLSRVDDVQRQVADQWHSGLRRYRGGHYGTGDQRQRPASGSNADYYFRA